MSPSSTAERLAKATDELNHTIVDAEAALMALGLGVRAEIHIPNYPGRLLLFGKDGRAWRLFWGDEKGGTDTPLINASREQRLVAVALLPMLVDAMHAAAEAETKRVEDATAKIRQFLNEF